MCHYSIIPLHIGVLSTILTLISRGEARRTRLCATSQEMRRHICLFSDWPDWGVVAGWLDSLNRGGELKKKSSLNGDLNFVGRVVFGRAHFF